MTTMSLGMGGVTPAGLPPGMAGAGGPIAPAGAVPTGEAAAFDDVFRQLTGALLATAAGEGLPAGAFAPAADVEPAGDAASPAAPEGEAVDGALALVAAADLLRQAQLAPLPAEAPAAQPGAVTGGVEPAGASGAGPSPVWTRQAGRRRGRSRMSPGRTAAGPDGRRGWRP
ncbi:MAG: hypothetical protein R2708_23745 [Vicinamibacterales bacterium]